ncbi:hypothetical protein Y032_0274g1020 [Ancylostoma ceylanicum]|uniref:Uncharacterized protein n=1 Tax=Ancylostoma ceylanicum TaxID=53326 RepID=A0A016S8P1_9BILA|nr:hypothetical protein Y032_0274g1020 [Ancylostoma ceylanicum]
MELPPYRERLKVLNLESLKYRRVVNDLLFSFRTIRMEANLRASKYWIFRPSRSRRVGQYRCFIIHPYVLYVPVGFKCIIRPDLFCFPAAMFGTITVSNFVACFKLSQLVADLAVN